MSTCPPQISTQRPGVGRWARATAAAGTAIGGVGGAAAIVAVVFAGHVGFRRRGWWAVVTPLCGLAGGAVALASLSELTGDDGQGRCSYR